MFADFENIIKEKLGSFKSSHSSSNSDITRTPQRYKIKDRVVQELKLLSEGSFGFIWLAEDVNTKQKFALKRIVCITKERFILAKNQLDIMNKFPKSKYLVECFGGQLVKLKNGNVDTQVMVILMEYCPNGTLFDLLTERQNKGFTQNELVQITGSILQGLKNIHASGCYHQDVKIQNVLVGADRAFKLCDFGSCSNRFIDFASINKSEYGHIKEEIEAMTTPMYRPPEVVDPYLQYQVNYKVDVWMVGCVLYTLAYFTHPFVDSNAVGIAGGVYRFPNYPDETKYRVSQKIKDLIRNFLTPNPSFRPSVDQALRLVQSWNTISQIPLNKEALRRKSEQVQKQKEMKSLNKRVVDFDGDIPMEKLLEIQKKLKNNDSSRQVETKTFVTSKNTIPSSSLNLKKPSFSETPNTTSSQHQQFFDFGNPQTKKQPSKPKPNTITSNSFWNTPSSNQTEKKQQQNYDDFSDFFGSSKNSEKQVPNDVFDYFLVKQEDKQKNINPTSKKNETNLLDL